ncbi:KAP family P-loop NTPase fold protein [Fibrobacter sp.]
MAKQDLLQREEYVKLLESLINNKVHNHQGFSFAINGSWGCGKSFILRMLEKSLDSNGYLVIHYNCWDNDFYKEPLIAILSTIVDKLNNISLPETEEYKQKRDKINIALKFLKNILFMVVKNKFGIDFEKIGIDLGELKENVSKTLEADKKPVLSNNFDSNLFIQQIIKDVREHLLCLQLEWNGIVFIVDELDRCLPNYAIGVLERLHHICFDSENDEFRFIQLLAINKNELSDSIYKAFGKDAATGNGESQQNESQMFAEYYLQKFVQLIIPVPPGAILNDSSTILNGFEDDFFWNQRLL